MNGTPPKGLALPSVTAPGEPHGPATDVKATSPRGPFAIALHDRYGQPICLCMSKPKRTKTPREEHPLLIGYTEAEAATLAKAAAVCEMPRARFVRQASLAHAAKINKGAT
jgi:hypothetical protein